MDDYVIPIDSDNWQDLKYKNASDQIIQGSQLEEKFFEEYKKDIVSHFKTEDEVLFPFCKVLDRYIKFNSQEDLIYILENS